MQIKTSPTDTFKLGLFIDGFTLRKVNEYYRSQNPECAGINFIGLKNWVVTHATRYFWPGCASQMAAHYYHPYRHPEEDGDYRHQGVIHFSYELSKAGFKVHFASINYANDLCPNLELQNDALLYAEYGELDALVLVSTQGQYAELPMKLRKMNIPTLLLGWNFVYRNREREVHWHTDPNLRRGATHYIPMERIMDNQSDVLARNLFLSPKKRTTAYRESFSGFLKGMSRSA